MTKVKDPICGMMVDPERAPARSEHDGVVTYFCCSACQKKFEAARSR